VEVKKVRLTAEALIGAEAAAEARGLRLAVWMRDCVLRGVLASPQGFQAFQAAQCRLAATGAAEAAGGPHASGIRSRRATSGPDGTD